MPVVASFENPNLSHLLTRSDSLRSSAERSDGDLSSVDKRVSFNNDVKIKCIPNSKKSNNNKTSSESYSSRETLTPVEVHREAPPINPEDVEAETKKVLQQLEGIECSVSKADPSINAKKQDNRLYGLHALNNLDIAVNGKEVNSMPSYQEVRRNSVSSSNNNLSQCDQPPNQQASSVSVLRPTLNGETPPKPPRKNMTHYAQPALSGLNSDIESISSDIKRYHRKRLQEANNEDSAIASGDADDSTVTSSYTSRFLRRSPQRQMMSPSRTAGNMTDSEILRSPTEVLYAVSEKHKHRNNEFQQTTSSQTMDNSNRDHSGSRTHRPPPRAYVSTSRPRSSYTYSSREDLASNDDTVRSDTYSRRSTSENHRYKPKNHVKTHHSSRSLDRLQHNLESDDVYGEANKENTFKTRIQVISPERQHMIQNGGNSNRKPYKTTINTATDNILYRGTSTDNIQQYHYGDKSHYKVPKNARPVVKNYGHGRSQNNAAYDNGTPNGSPYRNSLQRPPSQQQQFQSTRLIKNMEANGNNRGRNYVDRDRSMMINRNRHYSGHSTSPDREGSPERGYNRQPRAPPRSFIQQRSPSSSPTRPPRSRSSPTRESAMVRRVNSRRGQQPQEVDRSPSVMQSSGGLRERSRDSLNRRNNYISPVNSNANVGQNGHNEAAAGDRLSKFIEYRGEDIMMPHAQDPNQEPRKPTLTDRERGQSLPPGATIESIRDFYKSSQYKSMYQLPPSPTRPAPVLERPERGSRTTRLSPSAGPRVSISEGDVTDESSRPPPSSQGGGGQQQQQGPPEKMPRHHRRPVSTSALRPSSTKRQAPSPPVAPSTGKGLVVRRVVSSDGRASSAASVVSRNLPIPNSNVQKAPSMRRIVVGSRRSSVDNGLDSSFSESEGPFNGEAEQPRPWSSLSDDDLEDEIEYVLAVTNGIVDGHLNEDQQSMLADRPLSGIMSTTSSRPSTSATIVHVHSQPPVKIMPAVHRDHSFIKTRGQTAPLPNSNSVVFHENPTQYHTIIKDKQPLGEFGRRWTAATPHSTDIESDYRRDMATSSGSVLHQEARSRDGGGAGGHGMTSYSSAGRLSRGSSKNNVREESADVILRSTTDLERSNSNSAREEERRKVLEIEGVIRQPHQQGQLRANVTRSASRASRTAQINNAGPRGYKPGVPRHLSADADRESQYSGHSSSQTVPLPGPAGSKLNRFDQHRVGVGRVRRSTSNANAAAMGGVRREINQRKTKLPGGSLTSSINSSESEQGSHAGQSAVSRNTARSNRSVFLHAAAVADIPSPADEPRIRPGGTSAEGPSAGGPTGNRGPAGRSLSAESRDNLAVTSGTINAQTRNQGPPPTNQNSNLKGSKKISRSISLLAPWKPRPVLASSSREINYDNGNLYANPATRVTVQPGNMPPAGAPPPPVSASSKPPRPPTAPPPPPPSAVRRNQSATRRGVIDHSKSASSSDLLRDEPSEDTTPAVILAERKAAQTEAEKKAAKVSRSMSMPKDSRLAGWFKKRKRVA